MEETPKSLDKVVPVAYLVQHKQDYERACKRIQQKVRQGFVPSGFVLRCVEVENLFSPSAQTQQECLEAQRESILQAERILLHTLGFDFNVEHPYKHLLNVVKRVNQTQNVRESNSRSLAQVAWNFANDRSANL